MTLHDWLHSASARLRAMLLATTAAPPAPTQLFASDSVWNKPLADSAAIDPTSATRMSALVTEIQQEETAQIGPWIDERSNSTPFYVVGADQPKVPVKIDTNPL